MSDLPHAQPGLSDPKASSRKPRGDRLPAPDDLHAVLADCWTVLSRGAVDRRHPFHLPALANLGPQGRPEVRTVVLRGCDSDHRTLWFHTDRRSPKIDQLVGHPSCVWLFYSPAERVQLRVAAFARVHTDDACADAAWNRTQLMSRRCYLAPEAPSQPTPAPSPNLPEWALEGTLTGENTAHARERFALVRTTVTEIDWLLLHHAGHRRARFRFNPDTPTEMAWLQP
jgi:hypothetical protein